MSLSSLPTQGTNPMKLSKRPPIAGAALSTTFPMSGVAAETRGSPKANKLLMQQFTEFINTASEKLADELISSEAVFHVAGQSHPMQGPAGYLAIIQMMRGGFPDIEWTLEEMVAEDDKVAARFTMRGTHLGAFFGVSPTGKKISVQAMNIYRLSRGQILEERGQPDMLTLLQQIGAAPAR
jgi:steroid delta-isomerase-like uncharacterized protein